MILFEWSFPQVGGLDRNHGLAAYNVRFKTIFLSMQGLGAGGYLAPFRCLVLGTHRTALHVSTCHTFIAAATAWHCMS